MHPAAPLDTSCPPTGPAVVPASPRVGLRARGLRHREGPARLCRKRDKQQVPDLEKQNLAGVHLRDRDTLLGGSISLGAQHGDEGGDPLRWGGHGTPWAGSSQEGARGERGDIQVYFLQKNKLPPSSTPPQPSRPQGRRDAQHRAEGRTGGPWPLHSHGKGSVHGRSVASPWVCPRGPAGCPLPWRWSPGRGFRAAGAGDSAGLPPAPAGPHGASTAGHSRCPAAGCG